MKFSLKWPWILVPLMWQSPRGKRVASMPRWIWSIAECNLMTCKVSNGTQTQVLWNTLHKRTNLNCVDAIPKQLPSRDFQTSADLNLEGRPTKTSTAPNNRSRSARKQNWSHSLKQEGVKAKLNNYNNFNDRGFTAKWLFSKLLNQ